MRGTRLERLVVQTDWENDEAVTYLQHRFSRLGLDDALANAGVQPGDEVRICGLAFAFEGAPELADDDDELSAEDIAQIEAMSVDASEDGE